MYIQYFLCLFPLLTPSHRTNPPQEQYRSTPEDNPPWAVRKSLFQFVKQAEKYTLEDKEKQEKNT